MSLAASHTRTAALLLTTLFVLGGAFGAFAPAVYAADPPPASGSAKADLTKNPQPPADKSGIDTSTYGWVMTMIMGLFAWLVGVAAITLDNAVYYSVLTMGDFVKDLSAIGVSWRILRDIGNIFLIFGFIAVGVTTILSVDWYGGGTKMLPMLLVAAVLLNFSLFISMAVIDVGNLFATQFYTQINNGEPPGKKSASLQGISNEGISNAIMNKLGLQKIYGEALDKNKSTKTGGTSKSLFDADTPWYVGFMGILLFLITAFVLFSLAFILIARFVALIFLMVVAPIGFAGLAVPKLAGVAKMWWGQLFEQTITAPVLLLLLYVALAVIIDPGFFSCSGKDCEWTGIGKGNVEGFAVLLFSFLIAMGLLLAVVIIAKRMSAFGGSMATRMGGRLSFGAVSWGGRLAIGGAGVALSSKRMQGWATPKEGEKGVRRYMRYALRPAVFTGKGLRAVKYDPRSKYGLGSALGALGIDAGTEAKMTPQQLDEVRRKYQPGVAGLKLKEGQFRKESRAEYTVAGRERDFRVAERELGYLKADLDAGRITQNKYDTDAEEHDKVIATGLSKMSTKQLEELTGIKQGVEALVKNLSPQQFEAVMKSDQITETEKAEIRTARNNGLKTKYADTAEYHTPPTHPTPGVTQLSKNPTLLAAHARALAAAAAAGTPPPPAPTMTRGEQAVRALSNEQATQLSDKTLLEPNVYENLSIPQLNAIMRTGKVDDATTRTTIGAYLRGDPDFTHYFRSRTPSQQADLIAFWHL